MVEDLGMIACRAMDKAWSLPANESWQAVAEAVVAAHEARRWRSIDTAPKDGAILAWSPERAMVFQVVWRRENNDWSLIGRDGVSRMEYSHWTPIPAPPKEVEHAK